MQGRPHPVSTAFWSYVIPMTATRAMRIGAVLFALTLIGVVVTSMAGFLSRDFVTNSLEGMRHFIVMLGLPVGAVLLSEIPIRDGMTHRTLLYPLLGPVPRTTLAVVRVCVTASVLAIGAGMLLLLIRLLLKDSLGPYPRELLSVTLGSFAYVAAFGLVHFINRRGLIAGLAILFLFDMPLGRLPFTLRNVSPSYHVGVIAGQEESMQLPVSFGMPESSVLMSSVVLIMIATICLVMVAAGFKRKDLGDLC